MTTLTIENTRSAILNDYTVDEIKRIIQEAKTAARDAATAYIEQYGEHAYCGFAWVNIWDIKGNTKLGKRVKAAGLDKDYTGAYNIWNPSGLGTQCMSTKEAGASAAAQVFKDYGFKCSAGSRAD